MFLYPATVLDSINQNESRTNDTIFIQTKSPWGAVLRSSILPGWGQFYNESYWKIPVFWGISAWFLVNYFQSNTQYNDYRDRYLKNSSNEAFKLYREFYRDQRDMFALYFFLAYFANLVDAYVDAHLFDFDVKEDYFKRGYQINMGIKLGF